jgi:hypothetical protein
VSPVQPAYRSRPSSPRTPIGTTERPDRLGSEIGAVVTDMHRQAGVERRLGTTVTGWWTADTPGAGGCLPAHRAAGLPGPGRRQPGGGGSGGPRGRLDPHGRLAALVRTGRHRRRAQRSDLSRDRCGRRGAQRCRRRRHRPLAEPAVRLDAAAGRALDHRRGARPGRHGSPPRGARRGRSVHSATPVLDRAVRGPHPMRGTCPAPAATDGDLPARAARQGPAAPVRRRRRCDCR